MKKIILATLAAATVMTPVVAQAATVPVETSRNALQMQDQASFQRGEGRLHGRRLREMDELIAGLKATPGMSEG